MVKPVSPYKFVSHPMIRGKDHGWVAQKRGVGYQARFATAQAAAEWIAGKMGVTVDSLRHVARSKASVKVDPSLPFSMYRGVVQVRGRWVARSGVRELGRFGTELEAAQCVARVKNVKVKSLRRRLRPGLAKRLFRAAYKVFSKYCPGDLVNMLTHESVSRSMYMQETV